ncbi:MAG: class I SAM-dependent methyltransferase [Flavobacteriales bacterium]|nr:class I SAM-dependent methyltransferase [Flavobacteriales bacterium]
MKGPQSTPPYGRKNSIDLSLSVLLAQSGKSSHLTIVEVGTIRGMDEAHSNGWSTLAFAAFCKHVQAQGRCNATFYSIDVSENACSISRSVLDSYGLSSSANVVCENAHTWILRMNASQIDFLYVDGWDYHLGNERESEVETLKFVKAALPKLSDGALILFDDNFDGQFTGKGKLAIPYLLSEGWIQVAATDHQVLLVRNWIYS